ncbi:M28 family peptidase [Sphingomonas sp. HHU CXW]|uniref:M28 family peptidase n=1 Tax=Sphingomonas hominis TaxID=2741495 RepID=A0ABX2JFQ1_9SPHN|nr:M28 family peptidase [Sphingomonas hominis]NTS65373.1 M28 family peptidase [Sphingomonas hominis]
MTIDRTFAKRLPAVAAMALVMGAAPPQGTPASAPVSSPPSAAVSGEEAAIRAHVAYLADDALQGREAGSAGFDTAAQYVARQFEAAGLKPGADGAFLQRVPLMKYQVEGAASASIGDAALAPGVDFTAAANPQAARTDVAARVVFVGQGVSAPTRGHDDYAKVDVRGAIVALVGGAPADMQSEEHAYFASMRTKLQAAAAHGAVGAVLLTASGAKARPVRAGGVQFGWATPEGTAFAPGVPLLATFTDAGARKLFAGAATTWDQARGLVNGRQAFPPAALATTLRIRSATRFTPVASSNVVGVLPGTDPARSGEVVVLSAHLDHIGVSAKPNAKGDRINNGALDDAIGIASLIEEARRFQRAGAGKRTVVFLAVTAEEKGLVGSDYFVRHRPGGLENIVADVNLDMPVLTYRFADMVAFGGDRSTLGPVIARAANSGGVTMSPDPIPEQTIFTRSDHFRFVEAGVPSVFLWPGLKGDGARAAFEDFMKNRYHQPGDEVDAGILWDQAVRFVDINYRVAREIADAPTKPVWNKGDYFGTAFKGPMAN